MSLLSPKDYVKLVKICAYFQPVCVLDGVTYFSQDNAQIHSNFIKKNSGLSRRDSVNLVNIGIIKISTEVHKNMKFMCINFGLDTVKNKDVVKSFFEKGLKFGHNVCKLQKTQKWSHHKNLRNIDFSPNSFQNFEMNQLTDYRKVSVNLINISAYTFSGLSRRDCEFVFEIKFLFEIKFPIDDWNNLPSELKEIKNENTFKDKLRKRRSQSGYGEYSNNAENGDTERLRELEEEQEQLNNSLMCLTSHFAQVQFRLKQIVDASPTEKETLLQELEEFANRGIPDTRNLPNKHSSADIDKAQIDHEEYEGLQRQKELIEKLKIQLEDLENYAYQTGEGGIPQSKVVEKQRVIIDQLRGKLNLNVDELDKLSVDDLRVQVDAAMRELINPLKMKEQLVSQLQTQITDLERFIDFLQGDGVDPRLDVNKSPCKCGSAHSTTTPGKSAPQTRSNGPTSKRPNTKAERTKQQEQLRRETENIMQRASTLMNMLTFGCGPSNGRFRKNTLKKTPQGNHWGDLRAALEVSINTVLDLISVEPGGDSDYTSESEESPMVAVHEDLTVTVRKHFAMALRDLIQHGLMPVGQSQSLVPFLGCFPQRSNKPSGLMHAWDLILKYYHLKKGATYNQTPARRLSQSFNLEITGGTAVTNKQTMLGIIGSIISSHTPLKRSYDSHFKAFVCAALNQKKLITWLRLIFRTQTLVENYYQPWSYVSKTGFEDSFRSLEKICKYNFDLPVNLAVRPFQNIKDAF
ncbi:unnamed protein product, partial [Meganyctiphanes norvegica]